MLSNILSFLMKSKGAKVGAGALGGSGLLALVFGLHADVLNKIDRQDKSQKEYVQLVINPLKVQNDYLQKEILETKDMVRDIRNYLLKNN